MAARTSGSSTPCCASNTMVPPWPAPTPAKDSFRMSVPRRLSTSGRVNSEREVVPTAPSTAPISTSAANHRPTTRRRCAWHQRPRRANTRSSCGEAGRGGTGLARRRVPRAPLRQSRAWAVETNVTSAFSAGPVAHRLDVVAVRVPDEGPVVVLVVLGEDAWLVEHLGPRPHGGVEEGMDGVPIGGGEGDVGLPRSALTRGRADPEVGLVEAEAHGLAEVEHAAGTERR